MVCAVVFSVVLNVAFCVFNRLETGIHPVRLVWVVFFPDYVAVRVG